MARPSAITPAEVEHDDAVAHRDHEVHVVVDEHHGDRARRSDAISSPRSDSSPRVESAGGLVEQQQLGLADQCARERDPLLDRVGQRAGQPIGDLATAEPVQRGQRALAQPALVAVGPRQAEHRAAKPARGGTAARPAITFSSTVRPGNSPTPCSVRAIPSDGQPVGGDAGRAVPAPAERARLRP